MATITESNMSQVGQMDQKEVQKVAQKLLAEPEPIIPAPVMPRPPRSSRPRNAVAKMTRHKEVLRRILLGHKIKDIAKDLSYHPSSISVLVRTEAFQIELRRMQEIVFEHVIDEMSKFQRLVPLARQFYQAVLEDEEKAYSPRLKFDVSKDLLNRSGLKEAAKIDLHMDGTIQHQIGDVASHVKHAFAKAQTMDAEAVRIDPEGELERVERLTGDHQASGDELAMELKELMSEEVIDIIVSSDDGVSPSYKAGPKEDVSPLTKEEEESILDDMVSSKTT